MSLIALLFIITAVFSIIVGTPLFAIVGGAAVFCFAYLADVSITALVIEMARLANAPGIIAIPFFTFAGYIFAESKAADRLINMSEAIFGWMPGGLCIVILIACTVFSAMTGASAVTIIAIGGLLLPALIKEGYDDLFSLGITTSAGSLGLLFVPSLPIIIYGMVARVDIVQLFIAGILPGSLAVIMLILYGIRAGIKFHIPRGKFYFKKVLSAMWDAKWEIPLPIVVVGGIYGGYITVGEAASVAVFYAIVSECLIYREISLKQLFNIATESMIMVGSILIILGCALGFTNFLVDRHIPQEMMTFLQLHIQSKIVFLLALNVFLLIVGCTMDIFSAIIVIVPLISPVALGFGIDPVHLAMIFLMNLEIGFLTPPIGLNLFVSSARFNEPVLKLFKSILPFFFILLAALLIITYVPQLSLFLINLLGQRPPLLEL
ncbi:MAG: TRAP transporter large permease [Thermodesulfobacteriota bacterium]|nr:TRAP transporter large permease [Thermodesulfobacteriota bacterium]